MIVLGILIVLSISTTLVLLGRRKFLNSAANEFLEDSGGVTYAWCREGGVASTKETESGVLKGKPLLEFPEGPLSDHQMP